MRFVKKPYKNRTKKLRSKETMKDLVRIANKSKVVAIKDSIYRDPYDHADEKRSHVEDQLALSYYNKCAYCERLAKADIEHYRPKKKIDGVRHAGYYWLCYEWSNLLPACVKCNRDGAKHTKFPIYGTRVTKPLLTKKKDALILPSLKAYKNPLKAEKPWLLHPEIDKPENNFSFEIDPNNEGIRLKGIDRLGRGEKTIEICLLNRQELKLERQRVVIDHFVDYVSAAFSKYYLPVQNAELITALENSINTLIEQSKDIKKTHTYLRKYIVKNRDNFRQIALHYIVNPKQKSVVSAAFDSIVKI